MGARQSATKKTTVAVQTSLPFVFPPAPVAPVVVEPELEPELEPEMELELELELDAPVIPPIGACDLCEIEDKHYTWNAAREKRWQENIQKMKRRIQPKYRCARLTKTCVLCQLVNTGHRYICFKTKLGGYFDFRPLPPCHDERHVVLHTPGDKAFHQEVLALIMLSTQVCSKLHWPLLYAAGVRSVAPPYSTLKGNLVVEYDDFLRFAVKFLDVNRCL